MYPSTLTQRQQSMPLCLIGAKSTAEAIFEVKLFTACKSWYNFNNTTTNPADCRAKMHYTPDVVGDGNSGITGPFESAQNPPFHCGQVIPLCAGAFGEVNLDFPRLIKILAGEASASE
eukprot:scaffold10395_cov75-Cyclotella_meneghiniana.AAC.2